MLKIERNLLTHYKTEIHAYLKKIYRLKVPTPSHSPKVHVLEGISEIYVQGDGNAYSGCIPAAGEVWTTKDGTVLPLEIGDIYVTEFADRTLEKAIAHEILEKAQVSKAEALIPKKVWLQIYYSREDVLNAHASDLVKIIRPGALLRAKGSYFNLIIDLYREENFDLFNAVAGHFGAYTCLYELSQLIKEKFPRINLKDKKKFSRFSKSRANLILQVARQQGYYFNQIAERIENPPQIFLTHKDMPSLIKPGETLPLGLEESLGNDSKLESILKDAYEFDLWKDSLGVRWRDEPFWEY